MHRLKEHSPKAGARAVILAPTRELALQTHKVVAELGRFTSLRTAILVGGDSMEAQFAELTTNPDVIVATPGCPFIHACSYLANGWILEGRQQLLCNATFMCCSAPSTRAFQI